MKRSWVLGGLAVMAAAFAWLLFGGLKENVVFFLTPQEVLAKGTDAVACIAIDTDRAFVGQGCIRQHAL